MTQIKPKIYTYFIGIDVSRNELDYAVMKGKNLLLHCERLNNPQNITEFITELKLLPNFTITKAVFTMEHTGIYCNHLIRVLKKLKANVVIENSLQIKNSSGVIRGKYDKIDAIRIAQYSYNNREKLNLYNNKRPIMQLLASLFSLRNRLLKVQKGLKVPLKEQISFEKKGLAAENSKACKRTLKSLESDLDQLEHSIDDLIKGDDRLNHLIKIITSVPFVGRICAIQVIISTNEFKDIQSPKRFACYAGVAPFKNESGIFKGKAKVSTIANKRVKTLLHICAVSSLRGNSELKQYYNRKVNEGKARMAVLNAIRNKLILRIFACVNQDRAFEKEYDNIYQFKNIDMAN